MNPPAPVLKWKDERELARRLAAGNIGCTPTETVAGILGRVEATARINAVKQSPDAKPLALLAASAGDAWRLWGSEDEALRRMSALWPGPLTIIAGEGDGLAVRVPDFPPLLQLLRLTGPLVCTSANFSGQPAPATPRAADPALLSALDFVIDEAPPSPYAVASTILRYQCGTWTCLREGALPESVWRIRVGA